LAGASWRKVNLILSNLYSNEIFECTPSELDTLRSIAAQCPLEGGGAVFQARGLLEILVQEHFNTGPNCSVTEERRAENILPSTNIQITPNPNNGNFQISLPSGIITDWKFELFDLNGRSQWQSSTPNDFVQISGIPSGFYFLICSNKLDGRKVAKRLVIQK